MAVQCPIQKVAVTTQETYTLIIIDTLRDQSCISMALFYKLETNFGACSGNYRPYYPHGGCDRIHKYMPVERQRAVAL